MREREEEDREGIEDETVVVLYNSSMYCTFVGSIE